MRVDNFNSNTLVEAWIASSDIVEVVVQVETTNGPEVYCGYFSDPGTAAERLLKLPISGPISVSLGADSIDRDSEQIGFRGYGSYNRYEPLSNALKSVFSGTAIDDAATATNALKWLENWYNKGTKKDGDGAGDWQRFIVDLSNLKADKQEPLIRRGNVEILGRQKVAILMGRKGSGKSTQAAIIAAAAVAGSCLGYVSDSPRKVVFLNIELPPDELAARMKNAFAVAGLPAELMNLVAVMDLRGSTVEMRIRVLESVSESLQPDIIICDTAAGFVANPNDLEESKAFAEVLIRLAMENNAGILCTIHTTKEIGGDKARGHVGNEIVNIGSVTMEVANKPKETGVFTVSNTFHRSAPFGKFSFRINADGSIEDGTAAPQEQPQEQEATTTSQPATTPPVIAAFLELMEPGKIYRLKDLKELLRPLSFGDSNIERYSRVAVADKILLNPGRGIYQLNDTERDEHQ